ncbi:hypothetical protein FB45DRAFT_982519 [Roridomyces roridus]|uniref:DUF1308 domain-containing protein n=1 Tax=Roridomyces roridus TaxID=1738132 RepID=A0AAD7B2S3_9AGAR|nr:hypothetical protein FB45DRAFT_982519 [Roridomyces roridus]
MHHPELHALYDRLVQVFDALLNFKPLAASPPILDASQDSDPHDDGQWLRHENIPGIKKLRESIKYDIDILRKAIHEQPVSTHAPYLLAVYNEILCAPPAIVSVFKFWSLEPTDGSDRRERKGQRAPSTKVDVVAENGRRWIRINTIKNAGILAELREIDSYLTDSDSDSDDPDCGPSLAQKEFDNSILQMGRSLIDTAKAHPIDGSTPNVTMRLTRLDVAPFRENGEPSDPRIAHTVQLLRDMGIHVELGERPESEIPVYKPTTAAAPPPPPLQPTRQINIDLSALVALCSDLTHAPLPTSIEEAQTRFLPQNQKYREWKPQKADAPAEPLDDTAAAQDVAKHSRHLTEHLLQEMRKGLLQELQERLFLDPNAPPVEFWTSDEARERCMRIVSRIGGDREVRRAEAIFPDIPIPLEEAERLYWQDSRYPANFIPLLPIRIYPAPPQIPPVVRHPQFFRSMTKVCQSLLQEGSLAGTKRDRDEGEGGAKINSRLSPHAVKSVLRGAERGWTTLTTTKSSVKALLREIKAARLAGKLVEEPEEEDVEAGRTAVLWIVDPRNLQCFA